jgi:hypothetical protein
MAKYLGLLFFICIGFSSFSQQKCSIDEYVQQQVNENTSLKTRLEEIDVFTRERINRSTGVQRINGTPAIIKIPVVFHVLYHTPEQNIPLSTIELLIAALNRDFNKRNFDTTNTPLAFKPYAAAMDFEFKLATMDPYGAGTNGVIRKYTPLNYWMSDDKMKFSSSYGDDAWDSKSYLNIWLCNMKDVLGYSTFPGMDPSKDGIVLSFEDIFKARGTSHTRNDFRTVVHEAGHWVNLYHIWGEGYCGDDKVDDTPKQSSYTPGCPSGVRISCSSAAPGDMYMNYMDFTDDACMNMFTMGQRQRARILFEPGGPRNSILSSKGLNTSMIEAAPLPDFYPTWLHVKVYPNPASSVINLYFEYDQRWMGREMQILDISGKVVMSKIINSKIQVIDVSRLNAGIYFIRAEKEEEKFHAKFVKL